VIKAVSALHYASVGLFAVMAMAAPDIHAAVSWWISAALSLNCALLYSCVKP